LYYAIRGLSDAYSYKTSATALKSFVKEYPHYIGHLSIWNRLTSPLLFVILFESRYSRKWMAYFLLVGKVSLNSFTVISDFVLKKFFKYSMKNINKKSKIWRGVVGIEPTIASCPEHSLVLQTRQGPAPLPLIIIIP